MNGNGAMTVTPQAGGLVRQGFGSTEMEVRETAAVAVAEREKATIQAMFIMAERKPRDWDVVRSKLLKDAQRYGFADSAIWEIPRGGKALSGPSIRFAEAALRCMGNVFVDMQVTLDAPDRRKVQIVIIDLESNLRFAREVQVEKTVERRKAPADPSLVVGTRTNSYGEKVFIVEATEEEILQKQGVQVSKVIRTEGLRLLPGDILEEVIAACNATIEKGIKDDPDAAKKKLVDGFAKLNVGADQLAAFLGHPVAQVQPSELVKLRQVYNAISQGQTTWHSVMTEKAEAAAAQVKAPPAPSGAQPAAENRGPNVAASTPTEATKETAQATTTQAPSSVPAEQQADPNTGEVPLTGPEKELVDALAASKTPGECLKAMKLVNVLPDNRKSWGRELFNARMKELAPVKAND